MDIRIDSLRTTAGFLKESPVEFAPGLTCIIGARGTCKSTIVETIRFVFDSDERKVNELCDQGAASLDDAPSRRGLVSTTLKGGLAKCSLTRNAVDGSEAITIEREIGSAPRIYQNGIQELVDHQSILNAIEVYSQGDLQRIADDASLRISLIDRPNKDQIVSLRNDQNWVSSELVAIGPKIKERASEIEARRADVRALESLQKQLEELQSQRPELSAELDAERTAAMRRKSVLERLRTSFDERKAAITAVRTTLPNAGPFTVLAEELRQLDTDSASILADGLDGFASVRDAIRNQLDTLEEKNYSSDIAILERVFEEQNARYYELRLEQQEINDSLKREDALKRHIVQLEKVQRELNQFLDDHSLLVEKRRTLRSQLETIGDQIYDLRQREVEKINRRHKDVVVLTLEHGTHSPEYFRRLSFLLQGSRLRGQEDVARDLAQSVRPCDLIDITEASDAQRLSTLLGRDLGQMARLLSFLTDRADIYELEGVASEDHLEITMYDREMPKPLCQLSKGQMATALLPLILRPAPYPLIFDQPEDDLDNSFIYKTLVEHIRELKQERQLIFVTHNANIPVLGEADSVVVMTMTTPTVASRPKIDGIDGVKSEILDLLEGGSDAFRRRAERYSPLLGPGNRSGRSK